MVVISTMAGASIMMNRAMTGLSREAIAGLVAELAPRWQTRHRDRLAARARSRRIGAGAKHRFGFADRLLATLVHLRHRLTHDVVAAWFGVHRSTITRSVAEVRPLLAERGCQVNDGVRLRTIADVVAYLGHHPRALMDTTEVRVRRPVEGRAGRDRFVSGKSRLNTMKALVLCDPAGRLLFCGQTRPGSMHDLTQARTAGLVDLLLQAPLGVQVLADAGYQGLGADTAGAVITPRPKPRKGRSRYRRASSPHITRPASDTPPSGSASSMPSDTSRTGGSWPATTADANTSTPPSAPSPACCPTTSTPIALRSPPGHSMPSQPHLTTDEMTRPSPANRARGR